MICDIVCSLESQYDLLTPRTAFICGIASGNGMDEREARQPIRVASSLAIYKYYIIIAERRERSERSEANNRVLFEIPRYLYIYIY